ncbi:MAG: hypothetical protein F4Y79_19320 [Gemmatimonadetes bacterium]|nr:hypothetical protein [Gemmatimonadota bacterium]
MATATKNTQAFAPSSRVDDDHKVVKAMKRVPKPNWNEKIRTSDLEQLNVIELHDFAKKIYVALDGGIRQRSVLECYNIGVTFGELKSRNQLLFEHGDWEKKLKKMGFKDPRSIQRHMRLVKGFDKLQLNFEHFTSADEVLKFLSNKHL